MPPMNSRPQFASPARTIPVISTLAAALCTSLLLVAAPLVRAESSPGWIDFGEAPWPEHPTLLVAKYQGKRLPVVSVDQGKPVVMVDGKRKTLSDTTPLVTQLAEAFHPAQVEFSGKVDIGKRSWEQLPGRHGEATELREYTGMVTLQSATEIPDVYVLVTYFNSSEMGDLESGDFCKSALFDVGTLRPGEPKAVKLYLKVHMPLLYSNGDPNRNKAGDMDLSVAYWQAFSHGVELKTNNLSDVVIRNTHTVYSKNTHTSTVETTGVGMFIYLRERPEHADAVEAWQKQNKKTNRDALPYAQTPLQPGTSEGLPTGLSATLAVGEDGKVTKVTLDPGFSEGVAKNLTRCLKRWLYLPALKKGSPTSTTVKVPLNFAVPPVADQTG